MEFELLDFMLDHTRRRVGIVLIKYYELLIECDVVYYPPGNNVWIRMPEYWYQGRKTRLCFWPTEKHSDEFQEKVLSMLYVKHAIDKDGIRELFQAKN